MFNGINLRNVLKDLDMKETKENMNMLIDTVKNLHFTYKTNKLVSHRDVVEYHKSVKPQKFYNTPLSNHEEIYSKEKQYKEFLKQDSKQLYEQ